MISTFFTANRQSLARAVDGGIVVLAGFTKQQRLNDSAHSFIQESNFWYLTGIDEPDWMVVIDGSRQHSWLVAPERSDVHITFDGGITNEQALLISGVDEVVPYSEIGALLRRLSSRHPVAYTLGTPPYVEHLDFELNPAIERCKSMLDRTFKKVVDCRGELVRLRAIKQPEELKLIAKAVRITTSTFESIHRNISDYKFEYEIEAEFAHQVRRAGADGCAYESIVAAGGNACTLHYAKNASSIPNRQTVLMDMGAQYGRYAADISRTYARGTPTKRQIDVHGAVESAHKRIIRLIRPNLSVEEYQRSVDDIMRESIASLGLGDDQAALRNYFPHAISHGLGLDVHDSLGGPKYLQPNMVLTVEPGIYIPEEKIGVRIEDDIVVTENGHKNLSGSQSTGL